LPDNLVVVGRRLHIGKFHFHLFFLKTTSTVCPGIHRGHLIKINRHAKCARLRPRCLQIDLGESPTTARPV
jgi:hypothetical protein